MNLFLAIGSEIKQEIKVDKGLKINISKKDFKKIKNRSKIDSQTVEFKDIKLIRNNFKTVLSYILSFTLIEYLILEGRDRVGGRVYSE